MFSGYGTALRIRVIAVFVQVSLHSVQAITIPPPCLTDGCKHSSSIGSFVLCLKNVLPCDQNTSNLNVSAHNTFFHNHRLFSVCALLPVLTLSIYRPVTNIAYFCANLPRRSASQSPLKCLRRLVFCGSYLIKLLA